MWHDGVVCGRTFEYLNILKRTRVPVAVTIREACIKIQQTECSVNFRLCISKIMQNRQLNNFYPSVGLNANSKIMTISK